MEQTKEKGSWGGKRAGAGRRRAYDTDLLDSDFDRRKTCTVWCSPNELDLLKALLPFIRKYKEILAMDSHEGGWTGTPEELQSAYEKACILPTMPELQQLVNQAYAEKMKAKHWKIK